jgi:hypothetical protein
MVSLKECYASKLQGELEKILKDSGIQSEFKWYKLCSGRDRFAANKIIDFIFRNYDKLRIDTLIWDMEDSRHKGVLKRNDDENLLRMYYHLACTTFSKHWPTEKTCWRWRPDHQSSINWDTLYDCIRNKKQECVQDLFQSNPDFRKVNLEKIIPSDSDKYPLIQVSDLFAGMGAYSWGHYNRFKEWEKYASKQISFFYKEKQVFSQSEIERFEVMQNFNTKCKKNKLHIAFDTTKGFKSYDPKVFINFWLYKPQSVLDRAPSN